MGYRISMHSDTFGRSRKTMVSEFEAGSDKEAMIALYKLKTDPNFTYKLLTLERVFITKKERVTVLAKV